MKKLKTLKTTLLILVLCLSQLAVAGRYTDNAEVVSVKEVYKDHTIKQPYQDCYVQTYRQRISGDGSATNELFGGLLGGALGHQLGKGSGKKVMTVAGALLGASIANDSERGFKTVNKQVCETKYTRSTDKRFSHYLVRYKYKDKLYSYTTGNRPDGDIRVRVNVVPITSF
jgi:uncharacterized protein YcfJ